MSRFVQWWRARWRLVAGAMVALALVTSPVWVRGVARRMAFFRVRSVEVVGVRYLAPDAVVARLALDTLSSVWADVGALARRVTVDPLVEAVAVERRLPGTLVVRVTERLPVALAPGADGLRPFAADGHLLPLDPAVVPLDLPVLVRPDTAVLRLLGAVREQEPGLFARLSDVRRVGRDELLIHVATLPVRTMANVSPRRLAEVLPVAGDLTRRQVAAAELDLRYRDQVIARLP